MTTAPRTSATVTRELRHQCTNGIQGLDLLGRKVTQHDGAGLKLLPSRIERTVDRAQNLGEEAQRWAKQLEAGWKHVLEVTKTLVQHRDPAAALANSSIYLECFGHIVIAWIWLDKVTRAAGCRGVFYDGKRQAARYFFIYELPKVAAQLDLLTTVDTTTLHMSPDWF